MRDSAKAMLTGNAITTGYRISFLANYLMGAIYARVQADFGFNRAEAAILFCLAHRSPLSGIEIAEMTGRPRNSISPAVGKLLRLGMILKEPAERNRKIELLSLTEGGKAMSEKVVAYFVARERPMLEPLASTADRELLDGLLARLIFRKDDWLDTAV